MVSLTETDVCSIICKMRAVFSELCRQKGFDAEIEPMPIGMFIVWQYDDGNNSVTRLGKIETLTIIEGLIRSNDKKTHLRLIPVE